MPYGIPKELGGESQKNVAKMEDCVSSVMSRHGHDKASAIAICKTSLGFTMDRAERRAGAAKAGRRVPA